CEARRMAAPLGVVMPSMGLSSRAWDCHPERGIVIPSKARDLQFRAFTDDASHRSFSLSRVHARSGGRRATGDTLGTYRKGTLRRLIASPPRARCPRWLDRDHQR